MQNPQNPQQQQQAPPPIRNKKKKPFDKQLPTSLANLKESKLFTSLLLLEKQVDAILVRKRLDIQESLSRSPKVQKTLRIYLGSMVYTSPENGQQYYTLQIQGKLLQSNAPRLFSSFFKACLVELGTGETIQWHKDLQMAHTDGFEVKRLSSGEDVPVRIILQPDYGVERFKLSEGLSQILNLTVDNRSGIIMALWQYIKLNKLQDSSDHRVIHCDESLASIFNVQQFSFPQIPELLNAQLSPADPVVLEWTIRMDVENGMCPYVVDLEVDLEDEVKGRMMKFVMGTQGQKEVGQLDQQITKLVAQVHVNKMKRDFMAGFAENPVLFLEKWIAAQSRDLETVLGENQLNAEWQRRSQFYHEKWTAEAVFHYLSNNK